MSSDAWLWVAVIAAGVLAWATKFVGHVVPQRLTDHPRIQRTALLVTVALLAALAVVQTFSVGTALVLDARVAAIAVAALALALRAPFIVVVVLAAATAAALRAMGIG
ncbi:MAG: branched-chain amino acid transporter AzlD [Actinobacteria bacterium HGW-Actinobacteria-4]|nr:MAG: branched-chain amino acid transporter AzlD [Actinobacteria bacterium HGW-Actinobacteria-4]